MSAFYNEHDPKAAAWLRELIKEGLIAPGEVDERDIRDIRPEELARFTQCHFFAGIGTWSHALRGAGWPDSESVWTASCPCQPFSASGKRAGFADERHLWPAFFHLVRVARPRVCFGEQVASRDGEAWLDLVQADMEGEGYRFAPLDLCAAGFGAPHIRQRLFFVADSDGGNSSAAWLQRSREHRLLAQGGGLGSVEHATSDGRETRASGAALEPCGDAPRPQEQRYGSAHLMADPARDGCGGGGRQSRPAEEGRQPRPGTSGELPDGPEGRSPAGGMGNAAQHGSGALDWKSSESGGCEVAAGRSSVLSGMDVSAGDGRREGRPEPARLEGGPDAAQPSSLSGELGDPDLTRPQGRCLQSGERGSECAAGTPGATNGFWRDAEWLPCRDGKLRPVEPGTFPLAHGAAERVGRLRGYGNAIVAPVAEAFIKAYIALQPGGPQ